VAARASAAGARVLLTTEKDIMRLEPIVGTIAGLPLPIVPIALSVSIDPTFSPWLAERLRAVRAG
jgi:hypothetical protein